MSLRWSNLFTENDILKIQPRTNLSKDIIGKSENIKLINDISKKIDLIEHNYTMIYR